MRWSKENGIKTVPPMHKHRYFFFVGNKRERRSMVLKLSYPIVKDYPKLEKRMYDAGPNIKMISGHQDQGTEQGTEIIQQELF